MVAVVVVVVVIGIVVFVVVVLRVVVVVDVLENFINSMMEIKDLFLYIFWSSEALKNFYLISF